MNGDGIFSDVPILDEDGAPLAADADELVGLAYEFFSYQDIESAITPVLPVRPEPEFAPGPDADLFRPWHGRRKRYGRSHALPAATAQGRLNPARVARVSSRSLLLGWVGQRKEVGKHAV
ncbi:hypothetical protein SAMN04244572_03729 [Azotobacter beijerinckii]|uniref:Uncharacterized protein n=2 Tax=Azotobacter beijerinckii TaxID=170623 RepID=A0A1H6Y8Q0_9GAMM|nr:hypothetical protein SAMN04244572_03729 [Azotobacter beijerinckii]